MSGRKVTKIRRRRHVFFGVIIFLMILIYLGYHAISFLVREKPTVYTIGEAGALASSNVYTGLISRSETVIKTPSSGLVNYYIPSSSRVSVGDYVYSVDEEGTYSKIISDSGLIDLKNADIAGYLNDFACSFKGIDFSSVNNLKYELNSRRLMAASASELGSFADSDIPGFLLFPSEATGIVEYYVDGYESINESSLSLAVFEKSDYEINHLSGMTRVAADDPVYKLITSELWSIYIPLSTSEAASLAETKSIRVRFSDSGLETTVRFELVTGAGNEYFGKLSLTRYMLRYANTRFIKIELLRGETTGLQIPKSAAASEEFYEIPVEYLTTGGNSYSEGFQISQSSSDLAVFKAVRIIYRDNENCYVEKSELTAGSVIVKPDSADTITVVKTKELKGAYQVNRGYAVFKAFEIIDESEDYFIIRKGSYNGLSAFDKIVLYPTYGMNGSIVY